MTERNDSSESESDDYDTKQFFDLLRGPIKSKNTRSLMLGVVGEDRRCKEEEPSATRRQVSIQAKVRNRAYADSSLNKTQVSQRLEDSSFHRPEDCRDFSKR